MSARYQHFLRPTACDRQPAAFLSLAVQSEGEETPRLDWLHPQKPTRWVCQYWRCEAGKPGKVVTVEGTSARDWWETCGKLLQKGSEVWAVSADAVRVWSLLGLWTRLEEGSVQLLGADYRFQAQEDMPSSKRPGGYMVIEDPPTVICCRVPGLAGRLRICDVRNWGVSLPSEKETIDDECEWVGHFIRSMVSYLKDAEWGSLKATSSSQAWYTYRRRFLAHAVLIHTHPQALLLERAAMHGGRCEAFRVGKVDGTVYHVDFRAHYPAIGASEKVPVRLCHYGPEWDRSAQTALDNGTPLIARVQVETEWPHLPFRRDGLTVFPVGKFWTVLCGPELTAAQGTQEIVKYGEWATYEAEPALADYMKEMLCVRILFNAHENSAMSTWAKALAVGLVGRMGQRGRVWVDAKEGFAEQPYGVWTVIPKEAPNYRARSIAGRLQREVDEPESGESMPAIAAWIYSEGRHRLWQALLLAGLGEVYYCDTDSLFLSKHGFDRLNDAGLIRAGEPGHLRLVEIGEGLEIFGIRDYRFAGRVVRAGMPQASPELTTPDGAVWRRRGAIESLCGYRSPSADLYLQTRERLTAYRHGVVGSDNKVSPWKVK